MRLHITIDATSATLAARALMRSIDASEQDETPELREQLTQIAAVLDVVGWTHSADEVLLTIDRDRRPPLAAGRPGLRLVSEARS